jgi:photosystem II stability/assembly factor-like uncharacterized protein
VAKTGLAVRLTLLLSLVGLIARASPVSSAPDEVEWSRVNIPTEGVPGGWVLAKNSDVEHLTITADGTLYAYANPSGSSHTLFKSNDGGASWSHTGGVEDEIVSIATDSEDASVLYYATSSCVFGSSDGSGSFTELPPNPGGAGSDNLEITTLAAAQLNGHHIIAVGTKDSDPAEYGGVYIFEDEGVSPGWVDTEIGNYDACSLAFSPYFDQDGIIVAAVTDQDHTYVAYNYGTIGDWNLVELLDAGSASFTITGASKPCPAPDFDEPYPVFVGVVGGDGGLYEVDENQAQRLNDVNADIISLDLTDDSGTVKLMAGENDSAQVWSSHDGGASWDSATKAPTGSGATYVVMAPDFASSDRAYAATSGSQSAVSRTRDGGVPWNQIGLMDTAISTIIDLALSPNYSQDTTLFMLTWGGEHSLWRSRDDDASWERVFSSALPNVDSLSMTAVSPEYDSGNQVVFLAGTRSGSPTIWKSSDNGQSFGSRHSAPLPIDTWTVVSDSTLFLGGYDGSSGLVYLTTNSGQSYSTASVVGSEPLNLVTLSPDYELDETILIGNTNGWVYWSDDNGESFEPLPEDATSPPLTGPVTVAFDVEFSSNGTVYAASETPDEGIYRFITGTSTTWESLDCPTGGMLKRLTSSADGALYATNFKASGGLERSLNPTYSSEPTFETVTQGLGGGATLDKLWLQDNRLWAIDTTNVKLMTLTDTLASPVILTSPNDEEEDVGTLQDEAIEDVELDWETLSGATEYEWQLAEDADFSDVSFEGDTGSSAKEVPPLEIATTYHWRVRATEPLLSPWSEEWSFTTATEEEVAGPELIKPEADATGVAIEPVFEWTAVAGAEGYELIVATEASLDDPVILKAGDYALTGTTWECNVKLNYDTTYYWKVRAIIGESYSGWSAVGTFTTKDEPESPEGTVSSDEELPPPENPGSPPEEHPSPANTTTPEPQKYLLGPLLAAIILLSVIAFRLARSRRRPHL